MGLDISAYNNKDEEIAYLRISVWDYIPNMIWEKSMIYKAYGGKIEKEFLKEAFQRLTTMDYSNTDKWKQEAENKSHLVQMVIHKTLGKTTKIDNSAMIEDPDRLIKKYTEIKEFLIKCLELDQEVIKIKVVG